MSNAILFRMQAGIQGSVSRESKADIEAMAGNSGTPFPQFGLPGKLVGGLFVPLTAVGDVTPVGFLLRPFPTTGQNASDPLGTSVPQTTALANVLRRGYLSAFCQANPGSIVFGGQVFLRYASPAGAAIVGGVEATAIGATTVALTNAFWASLPDANGIAEIAFNL
jgi:hypothetical protein